MYHTIYRHEDILQVNKYLLKDMPIQNPGKDLRFGKIIIAFNYFCKKLHLKSLRGFQVSVVFQIMSVFRIFLNFRKYDRVLNMCRDAMMEELWILKNSEYPSI